MQHRRRAHLGLIAGVLLLTLSCGSPTAPTDAEAVLAIRLEGVDAAIAAGDYDRARTAVRALVTSTTRADRAGDLDGPQADRIMAAAAALLERLPSDPPTDEPTTTTPTTPTTPTTESSPQTETTTAEPTPAPQSDQNKGKGKGKGKGRR